MHNPSAAHQEEAGTSGGGVLILRVDGTISGGDERFLSQITEGSAGLGERGLRDFAPSFTDPGLIEQVRADGLGAVYDGPFFLRPGQLSPARIRLRRLTVGADVHVMASVEPYTDDGSWTVLPPDSRKYALLADNIPAMIGYWDKHLLCRYANNIYLEWFKRPARTILGMPIRELLGEDVYALNLPYIEGALRGVPQSFERSLTKGDNSQGHVWAQYIPDISAEGEVEGFYVLVTDITLLRESQRLLFEANTLKDTVIASTRALIVATDPGGTVTLFNRGAEQALGYAASEIVGKQTPALWHVPEEVAAYSEKLGAELGVAVQPGFETFVRRADIAGFDENEWTLVRKDRTRFPVNLTVTALKGPEGDTTGYLGVITDITEKKAQEEALKTSEETFKSAMLNASIGMALVGPDGRWEAANPAICGFLGYSEDELLSGNHGRLTHPDDVETETRLVSETLDGARDTFTTETRYIRKDGSVVWGLLSASLLRAANGRPRYFISQVVDITHRREVERMKDELISTVSHELRTPLTSIKGALDAVAQGQVVVMPQRARPLIDMARRNADRLSKITDDILDIDRISTGALSIDLNVEDVLEQIFIAIDLNGAAFAGNGRALVLDKDTVRRCVRVDKDRLQQIIGNILANAVKFSSPGSSTRIGATCDAERVRIWVHNEGPVIPEAFRAKIFEKFSQANASVTRKHAGSGLGLHISKRLAEAMNGTIGYESQASGTTFWIEFPLFADTDVPEDEPHHP